MSTPDRILFAVELVLFLALVVVNVAVWYLNFSPPVLVLPLLLTVFFLIGVVLGFRRVYSKPAAQQAVGPKSSD
jgi:hypothetical protein